MTHPEFLRVDPEEAPERVLKWESGSKGFSKDAPKLRKESLPRQPHIRRLFVTSDVFTRYFFVAFSWFFRGFSVAFSWPSSAWKNSVWAFFVVFPWFFRGFFVVFSWLFRGPRFGQILRVLALEKSSEHIFH